MRVKHLQHCLEQRSCSIDVRYIDQVSHGAYWSQCLEATQVIQSFLSQLSELTGNFIRKKKMLNWEGSTWAFKSFLVSPLFFTRVSSVSSDTGTPPLVPTRVPFASYAQTRVCWVRYLQFKNSLTAEEKNSVWRYIRLQMLKKQGMVGSQCLFVLDGFTIFRKILKDTLVPGANIMRTSENPNHRWLLSMGNNTPVSTVWHLHAHQAVSTHHWQFVTEKPLW